MRRTAFLISLSLLVFVFSCSVNSVKVDTSLNRFFTQNKVAGCFALFDNGLGKISTNDQARYFDSTFMPASTFKILNSLIGLQEGVISSDTMVIKWDGVVRSVEAWNKDLTMREAFRVSAVPYYQEVARRIGKEKMQFWLDSIGYAQKYGRKELTGPVDSFWLNNSIKVTPDEQLGLVKQLYFKQLPFFPIYQEEVKQAMLFEDNTLYRLSYKTGWSGWMKKEQKHIGWIIGWIEENNHPYFFVLELESHEKDFDMPAARLKILKEILAHLGFMEGKM